MPVRDHNQITPIYKILLKLMNLESHSVKHRILKWVVMAAWLAQPIHLQIQDG